MPDALRILGRVHLSRTQTRKEPSSSKRVSFNLRVSKTKIHSLGLDLFVKKNHIHS